MTTLLPLAWLAVAAAGSFSQGASTTAFIGVAPAGSDVGVALAAALAANSSVALQAKDVTAAFMQTAHDLDVKCDPALDECLLQLTAICTVQQGAFAIVDTQGRTRRLTLRLAVVAGGSVRTVTTLVDDRPEILQVAIREAVAELTAPATVAALVVDAPAESVISLDGLARGTAPLSSTLNGIAPGHHFVDVQFPDGAVTTKAVVLSAGQRTRIIAVPRPVGADIVTWTGWGSLGLSAITGGIATASAGVYFFSRSHLENFSTHYASPDGAGDTIDYNDRKTREDAITNHDLLTDLPTYGYPLFAAAGITAAVGGVLLFGGYRWSELFDPPSEETAR